MFNDHETSIPCPRAGCHGHLVAVEIAGRTASYFCSKYPKVVGSPGCHFRCASWQIGLIYGQPVSHLDALRVSCPKCNAERGFGCSTASGWGAPIHKKRVKLALETLRPSEDTKED